MYRIKGAAVVPPSLSGCFASSFLSSLAKLETDKQRQIAAR